MAVGHDQAVADDKAGAAVGDLRIARELDAADRGNHPLEASSDLVVGGQLGPELMFGPKFAVDYVDRRPQVGIIIASSPTRACPQLED